MASSIAYTRNYTSVLDEMYKRAVCSTCLNSPRRMARAGRNAKEIKISEIQVSELGDYTRNVGYKTGSISYEFEAKTFNYCRGIKLLAANNRSVPLTKMDSSLASSSGAHHERRTTVNR